MEPRRENGLVGDSRRAKVLVGLVKLRVVVILLDDVVDQAVQTHGHGSDPRQARVDDDVEMVGFSNDVGEGLQGRQPERYGVGLVPELIEG